MEEGFNPLDLDLAKAQRIIARVAGMKPATRRWYTALLRKLAAYLYEIHGSKKAKEIPGKRMRSPRLKTLLTRAPHTRRSRKAASRGEDV